MTPVEIYLKERNEELMEAEGLLSDRRFGI